MTQSSVTPSSTWALIKIFKFLVTFYRSLNINIFWKCKDIIKNFQEETSFLGITEVNLTYHMSKKLFYIEGSAQRGI